MKESVIYQPSEWQQRFHDTARLGINEVLGAGAAGPGKTTALLMDIVDQITVEHERCSNPNHKYPLQWGASTGWALHLRRTVKMLEQTITLSHRMFKAIDPGATWNENKTTWTFSSGFKYQFGHCKDPHDFEQFMSFEFCVAGGTPVLMADGSWKPIQAIKVGELVSTLEGARVVTATWDSGHRPCVSVTTYYQGEIVGRQLQPTTHPVLQWTIGESRLSRSACSPHTSDTGRESALSWQDYESLLCERPESPVRRVSEVGGQNGCVTFGGSLQAGRQLPGYCVPVALFAPVLESEGESERCSTLCPGHPASGSAWLSTSRAHPPHRAVLLPSPQQADEAAQRATGRSAGISTCDSEGALTGSEKATDSQGRCSVCLRLRGERSRPDRVTDLGSVRLPADAERRDPTYSQTGVQGDIPNGSGHSGPAYPHFYTGRTRTRTEEVRRGVAEIEFAGFYDTFDLTVDGANHYITSTGLVNANTAIYFDELTGFEEEQYDQITTRLRSTDPVLSLMLRIRAMSNPLMRHEGETFTVKDANWVRRRFVDAAPQGNVVFKRKLTRADGSVAWHKWCYMPAKLHDNPNKEFVAQYELQLLKQKPHIRAALLDGDWYVTVGSFFAEYWKKSIHVVRPFRVSKDWRVFRAMDWGFKKPGCIHWFALDDDDTLMVTYELRFQGKIADEVAAMVQSTEELLELWDEKAKCSRITGPADTQIWEQRGQGGKSIAETFNDKGITWTKADKRSRQTNAQHLIKRLTDHEEETKVPGIVFFESCKWIIQTLPAMQTSQSNSEEPADGGEDHPYDSCVYGCAYASKGKGAIPPIRPLKSEWDDEDEGVLKARAGRHGYGQELC